jgi:hypothetical protein
VIALNLATAKAQMEEQLAAGKELSQSSDPKAAMSLAAQGTARYGRCSGLQ